MAGPSPVGISMNPTLSRSVVIESVLGLRVVFMSWTVSSAHIPLCYMGPSLAIALGLVNSSSYFPK